MALAPDNSSVTPISKDDDLNAAQNAEEASAAAAIQSILAKIVMIELELKNAGSSEAMVSYLVGKYCGLMQAISSLQLKITSGRKLGVAAERGKMSGIIREAYDEVSSGKLSVKANMQLNNSIGDLEAIEITEKMMENIGGGSIYLLAGLLSSADEINELKKDSPELKDQEFKELSELLSEIMGFVVQSVKLAESKIEDGFEEVAGKNKDKGMGQGSGFSSAKEHLIAMFKAVSTKRDQIEEKLGTGLDDIGGILSGMIGHLPGHHKHKIIEEIEEIQEIMEQMEIAQMAQNSAKAQITVNFNHAVSHENDKPASVAGAAILDNLLNNRVGANFLKLEPNKEQEEKPTQQQTTSFSELVGKKDLGDLSPDAPSISKQDKEVGFSL